MGTKTEVSIRIGILIIAAAIAMFVVLHAFSCVIERSVLRAIKESKLELVEKKPPVPERKAEEKTDAERRYGIRVMD
jgi:hypothetical protein